MATYTVVSGDSLSSIASRFDTTADALAHINHITNPNMIYVGQVLTIPDPTDNGNNGASPAVTGSFTVGSGIALAMQQDGTTAATDEVYWHGIGPEVQWSEAIGANGTVYRWIKATNQVHRFRPA